MQRGASFGTTIRGRVFPSLETSYILLCLRCTYLQYSFESVFLVDFPGCPAITSADNDLVSRYFVTFGLPVSRPALQCLYSGTAPFSNAPIGLSSYILRAARFSFAGSPFDNFLFYSVRLFFFLLVVFIVLI